MKATTRPAAALAALTAAAALGIGAAAPAQAACTNTVINHVTVCVPNSDGGVGGGGTGTVGNGGSLAPGKAVTVTPSVPRPPGPLPAPKPKPAAPSGPAVVGVPRVGSAVKAAPGAWVNGTVLKYRWLRNGALIPDARSAAYKLRSADKGKKIAVRVTGTRAGHSTTRTSKAILPR